MLISACAVNSLAVTTSDTTQVWCEALYIGGDSNVAIKHKPGTAAGTYVGLTAGTILPVKIVGGQIMATNTTATNIVAMSV